MALFGRRYHWQGSYLPSRIDSRGRQLVKAMRIELTRGGETFVLVPDETNWVSGSVTRQVYEAVGRWNGLRFKVSTTLEFDGVADIRLSIDPEVTEAVDSIKIVADMTITDRTRFLGFPIDGIRRQKRRNDVLTLPYRGRFLAAVVAGDGDRSFWWFADSQQGWIGNPVGGTEILRSDQIATISQEIVRGPVRLAEPMEIRFGVLATPAKAVEPAWRRQRPALGVPSAAESRRGGAFKLWWPTAFAYDAYPYTQYHDRAGAGLPESDKRAYPGLAANRRLMQDSRQSFGIHWIPYFSAHVLSAFDPMLRENRSAWEVQPPYVFRDGLSPYSNAFDKPTLSHNAPGYTDYVLGRIAAESDELPMEGIYLDHGPPFDSLEPVDPAMPGRRAGRPSLDIFATRAFLKRLQTLFVTRGRAGYTFIHVSNREIIPAYTFAWALIDGEQYRSDVRDGRYLDLVSLDEFRMRFGTGQYGVRSYWIPGDWWVNRNNKEWAGSEAQRQAYRRTVGLALAHDVGVWAQGAPLGDRERLMGLIDEFGIERASFRGYWQHDAALRDVKAGPVVISTYRTADRLLAVALNSSPDPAGVALGFSSEMDACIGSPVLGNLSAGFEVRDGRYTSRIAGYDFALLVLKVSGDCTAGVAR